MKRSSRSLPLLLRTVASKGSPRANCEDHSPFPFGPQQWVFVGLFLPSSGRSRTRRGAHSAQPRECQGGRRSSSRPFPLRLNQETRTPFAHMLFFDDESRNIHDISKLGTRRRLCTCDWVNPSPLVQWGSPSVLGSRGRVCIHSALPGQLHKEGVPLGKPIQSSPQTHP